MTPDQIKAASDQNWARLKEAERAAKAAADAAHNEYVRRALELEAACEAAGGHRDDGGFMHGSCKYCGAFLG
jgi:hypothetical protein